MTKNEFYQIAFIIFIFFIGGCMESKKKSKYFRQEALKRNELINKKKLPVHIRDLENLTIYSPCTQAPDTIELVKKTIFESNKNVFIDGYISRIAVDNNGSVYIVGTKPGTVGIYVFKPDGSYLIIIGNAGKGPGEYESIGSISVRDGKLYILDPRLQKIGLFSLVDYRHIKDEKIKRDKIKNSDSLVYRLKGNKLFVTDEGKLLLRLRSLTLYETNDTPVILYYRLSKEGTIIPGSVLKLKRFQFYFPQKEGGTNLPFPMPFSRGSLIAITRKGEFFTAWTEDFLIKQYDKNGNYIQAFYYPTKKSELSMDGFDLSRYQQRALDHYKMPETWPALHTMFMDDQNRLWVFTITNSKTHYKGWVLNKKGKLLARFDWPGKRASRTVMSKPLMIVKNGYFYNRERDISKGIDRIVKYKIIFKKN